MLKKSTTELFVDRNSDGFKAELLSILWKSIGHNTEIKYVTKSLSAGLLHAYSDTEKPRDHETILGIIIPRSEFLNILKNEPVFVQDLKESEAQAVDYLTEQFAFLEPKRHQTKPLTIAEYEQQRAHLSDKELLKETKQFTSKIKPRNLSPEEITASRSDEQQGQTTPPR